MAELSVRGAEAAAAAGRGLVDRAAHSGSVRWARQALHGRHMHMRMQMQGGSGSCGPQCGSRAAPTLFGTKCLRAEACTRPVGLQSPSPSPSWGGGKHTHAHTRAHACMHAWVPPPPLPLHTVGLRYAREQRVKASRCMQACPGDIAASHACMHTSAPADPDPDPVCVRVRQAACGCSASPRPHARAMTRRRAPSAWAGGERHTCIPACMHAHPRTVLQRCRQQGERHQHMPPLCTRVGMWGRTCSSAWSCHT